MALPPEAVCSGGESSPCFTVPRGHGKQGAALRPCETRLPQGAKVRRALAERDRRSALPVERVAGRKNLRFLTRAAWQTACCAGLPHSTICIPGFCNASGVCLIRPINGACDACAFPISTSRKPFHFTCNYTSALRRECLRPRALPCITAFGCGCGGIGRRTWFRSKRREAWGFESLHPHHTLLLKSEKPCKQGVGRFEGAQGLSRTRRFDRIALLSWPSSR